MKFTGHLMAEMLLVCAVILGASIAVETNKIGLWLIDWVN